MSLLIKLTSICYEEPFKKCFLYMTEINQHLISKGLTAVLFYVRNNMLSVSSKKMYFRLAVLLSVPSVIRTLSVQRITKYTK